MSRSEQGDEATYKVVVDHEGQYSIWPADRENALGWTDAGKQGTQEECAEYMRRRSARGRAGESGRAGEQETGGQRGDL